MRNPIPAGSVGENRDGSLLHADQGYFEDRAEGAGPVERNSIVRHFIPVDTRGWGAEQSALLVSMALSLNTIRAILDQLPIMTAGAAAGAYTGLLLLIHGSILRKREKRRLQREAYRELVSELSAEQAETRRLRAELAKAHQEIEWRDVRLKATGAVAQRVVAAAAQVPFALGLVPYQSKEGE